MDPADQALSYGRGMLVLPLPCSVDAGFPQSSFFSPIFPASTLVHTCPAASQVLCGDDGAVAGERCGVLGNLLAGKLGYVLNFVIFAGLDCWERGRAC